MKEITIDAIVDNIGVVTDFVNGFLDEMHCPDKIKVQIDIAIDELFGNISYYAYQEAVGQATVRVEQEENPKSVCITFIDNGIPYDPLGKDDPDVMLSVDDRKIGGLGIYMVKKSMDEMAYHYDNGQNQFVIKKRLM